MAKGAAWSISARIAIRSIGLISTAILARLLVPEDFGLVALATVFITGLEATTAFSFDIVLIANQKAGRRYYDTAFTLGLLRSVVMAVLIVLCAVPASEFFENPKLEEILYWRAFATFVLGFENIALVDFRKHMNFGMDFAYLVGRKIGPFFVTVTLAFIWRDYWALVAGIVAGRFFEVAIGYFMRPYRPRLTLVKWRPVLSFSSWLMLRNLIAFLNLRSDTFVIGKVVGAQALGVYSVPHEIASLATSELLTPIRRALLPGFAKMAHDREMLQAGYLDSVSLLWMLSFPVAAGIGLTADPIVRLLLGEKWLDAIPLLQVLALYGLLAVVPATTGPILMALKKPQVTVVIPAVGLAVSLPLLIFATPEHGAYGAALAVTMGAAVSSLVSLSICLFQLSLSPAKLLPRVWRTPVSLIAMTVAVRLVSSVLPPAVQESSAAVQLFGCAAAGALTYIISHLALWYLSGQPDGAERHVSDNVGRAFRRVRSG